MTELDLPDITIDRTAGDAPYYQLYRELRHHIKSGYFPVGKRLPTVKALCDGYKLSRATVSRALGELSQDGLILARSGGGTHVVDTPIDTTELVFLGPKWTSKRVVSFYDQIVEGMRRGCADPNRRIAVTHTDAHPLKAHEILRTCAARRADSVIFYGPTVINSGEVNKVAAQIPTVGLCPLTSDCRADIVVSDPGPTLQRLLRQRVAAGQHRFTFVGRPALLDRSETSVYIEMLKAFRGVMETAAIEHQEIYFQPEDENPEGCRRIFGAIADGTTLLTLLPGLHNCPDKRFDALLYTESQASYERFRGQYTLLYTSAARLAEEAQRLVLRRKEEGPPRAAQVLRLAPEVIEKAK